MGERKPVTAAEDAAQTTRLKKDEFLRAYAGTGNVTAAVRVVGISRKTPYLWFKKDEAFREDFRFARREAIDSLESEARRRAVEGVEEQHFDKDGNLAFTVRKYSDTLLIFLLKGANPKKYNRPYRNVDNRDQRAQIGQQVNVNSNAVMVENPARAAELAEQRKRIKEAMIEALGGRPELPAGDHGHG